MDFYHSLVAVWVNSAPQPKRWGPRAHRGFSSNQKSCTSLCFVTFVVSICIHTLHIIPLHIKLNWDTKTASIFLNTIIERLKCLKSLVPRSQNLKMPVQTTVAVWCWSILSISFRSTSLALRQSFDCPSASEVTLKDMGKWIIWIYYKVCLHITLSNHHHYADSCEGTEHIKCLSGIFCLVCV